MGTGDKREMTELKYKGRFIENVPGLPGIKWFLDSDIPDDKIYAYDPEWVAEQLKKKELERINKKSK